jgi:L,D-peptidoglycan transpeptidase YkuD (ErfK/YbiS/YcfS/YnhG family)
VKPWERARGSLALLAAAVLATTVLAVGCAHGPAGPAAGTPPSASGPAGAASSPAGSTVASSAVPSIAGAARPADQLAGRQLITVSAASGGATYAALTAYRRSAGHWRRVFGPWTARIGRGGFAPPGLKREGDGRTPSGTFGFGFFFGVLPDPGVRFRYRQSQPYDFWDDDPASPRYNEWVDQRRADPGLSPEPMDVSGYDYGAVIAYNTARTPGLGSGIFLHVNIGIATAGCVTLPMDELLRVLRWLNPARSPQIRMGVGAGT